MATKRERERALRLATLNAAVRRIADMPPAETVAEVAERRVAVAAIRAVFEEVR